MQEPTNTPTSPAVTLRGKPAFAWATIARAERLAHAGAGWSADHVMRQALELLEHEHVSGSRHLESCQEEGKS